MEDGIFFLKMKDLFGHEINKYFKALLEVEMHKGHKTFKFLEASKMP